MFEATKPVTTNPKRSHFCRIRGLHLRFSYVDSAFSLIMRKVVPDFFCSVFGLTSICLTVYPFLLIPLGHVLTDFTGLEVIDLYFIFMALSLIVPNMDSFMPVAQKFSHVLSFLSILKTLLSDFDPGH